MDRRMDRCGLIAAVISAVGILLMLIFSMNENVVMAASFPTTLLSFCVDVSVRVCMCVSWSNADSQSKLWEFNLSRAMLCSPDN